MKFRYQLMDKEEKRKSLEKIQLQNITPKLGKDTVIKHYAKTLICTFLSKETMFLFQNKSSNLLHNELLHSGHSQPLRRQPSRRNRCRDSEYGLRKKVSPTFEGIMCIRPSSFIHLIRFSLISLLP